MMARNDRIRSCGHRRAASSASDDKNGSRKQNGSGGPIARTTAMTIATLRTGQKGGSGKVSDARERAPVAVPPPLPSWAACGCTCPDRRSAKWHRATRGGRRMRCRDSATGGPGGGGGRERPRERARAPRASRRGGAAASRRPPGRGIRASRRRFQSGRRRR